MQIHNNSFFEAFQDFIYTSQDLFAVFDECDCLIFANKSFCEAFDTSALSRPRWSDMMRESYKNQRGPVIATDDVEVWLASSVSKRGASPYRSFELELHDGRWIFLTETMGLDGHMLTYGTDFSNVHSDTRTLREERNEARRRAQTDELTGLPNRRFTFEQISSWLSTKSFDEGNKIHSLALLDLDSFKQVNDKFGHHIGDEILADFSQRICEFSRLSDISGRIGGEEFLMFLPGCTREVAHLRLDDIRREIAGSQPLASQPDLKYTFSAGLVEMCENETLEAALIRADTLLYRAKGAGKNRIES